MKTLEEYMSYPYKLEIVPDTAEGGYAASYTVFICFQNTTG